MRTKWGFLQCPMQTKAICAIAVCIVQQCTAVINSIAFHPDTSNRSSPARIPPGITERFITTSDNVRLQCYITGDTASSYAALYLHGNAGNNDRQVGDLFGLAKMDLRVVGVDYRGFGKSAGRPSENGVYLDGAAALRFVRDSLGYLEKNIFVIGSSLGTAVAVNTVRRKTVAGLVLVAPLTTGRAYARALGFGLLSLIAGHSFDTMSKIRDITSPLLVIHGTDDRLIPISMGREVYRAAATKKEFVEIEGGHHGDLAFVDSTAYWGAIFTFVATIRSGSPLPRPVKDTSTAGVSNLPDHGMPHRLRS